MGGHVVAIGAFGKSPKRKVIHREIENPVEKKSIHFEIAKSKIPTK
jgi:hypothetical protein